MCSPIGSWIDPERDLLVDRGAARRFLLPHETATAGGRLRVIFGDRVHLEEDSGVAKTGRGLGGRVSEDRVRVLRR